MSNKAPKGTKTLSDEDIETSKPPNRRRMLGLLGLGTASAGIAATATFATEEAVQIVDSDNGQWFDAEGCGRGSGGVYTATTDADNGTLGSDAPGYGRGTPTC